MNPFIDKDIAELKKLNELSLKEAVNTRLLDEAQMQTDISNQNLSEVNTSLDNQIETKKELLKTLNEVKTKGNSIELQNKINSLMEKLKTSSNLILQEQAIIKNQNINKTYEESIAESRKFAEDLGIDFKNPYMESFTSIDRELYIDELTEKFDLLKLDKYDYAYAAAVGGLCGMVDALLVGTADKDPNSIGKLAQMTDKGAEKLVMNFAKSRGWKGPKQGKDPVKSAIGWLERHYPVCFDHAKTSDIDGELVKNILPKNHHLLSISHSPLGIIFGIRDLLQGKATFIDLESGKLISVTGKWNKQALEQGLDKVESLTAAWERWLGHLMSDLAGSSGTSTERGSGLPAGFESILLKLNSGEGFSSEVAEIIHKMFYSGYDLRFTVATSIPVFLNELLIRVYWMLKQKLYYKKPMKECIPFGKSRELQRLLLVSLLVFEAIDIGHATIKGFRKASYITFFCSLNYIGLCDLALRVLFNFLLQEKHINQVNSILKGELQQKYMELMDSEILLELD